MWRCGTACPGNGQCGVLRFQRCTDRYPGELADIQATPDPRDGTFHYTLAASVAEGLAIDIGGLGFATAQAARGLWRGGLEVRETLLDSTVRDGAGGSIGIPKTVPYTPSGAVGDGAGVRGFAFVYPDTVSPLG